MRCNWISFGAAWCGLAVILGAFGAHGLKNLEPSAEALGWWETAAQYHFGHGLALVLLGLLVALRGGESSGMGRVPGTCFTLGSVIFSGTLYAMAVGAPSWFGAITPIGGVLLIAGWIGFALCARRTAQSV